jgi:hypothetical protein
VVRNIKGWPGSFTILGACYSIMVISGHHGGLRQFGQSSDLFLYM